MLNNHTECEQSSTLYTAMAFQVYSPLLGWARGMQIIFYVYIANSHSIHDKIYRAVKLTVLLL